MATLSGIALALLALLALTFVVSQTDARLPGVKMRITKKAIDYANQIAHAKLANELKTLKIPDQRGREGRKSWSVTSVQNRGSTVPATSMTLNPGQRGLTWSMSNLGLSLHANWRVKYKRGWFKFSTSGSVDVDFRGVSLQVTIALGKDSNGRPTISMAGCNANIQDVKLKFHKGITFILNLFKGKLGRKFRDLVKGQMCKIIQKEVNVDGTRALSKLKLNVKLAKMFLLDYGLVQAPRIMSTYLETEHKGEVYWIGDSTESPLSPKAFPAPTDNSKMLYLWLSEYSANTMAHVAQKHIFLQYNLVAADFPSSYLSFVTGSLSPDLIKNHPGAKLEASLKSTSTPVTTLASNKMTFDTHSTVSLYANIPGAQRLFLVALNVNLSLTLHASIANERLIGSVTDYKFDVSVANSNLGDVTSDLLNYILKGAMKFFAIPRLNKLAQKGIDLPVTAGGVKFINPSIHQVDGSILIATDIRYL